jgi:hypothetical protein
VKVDFEVGAGVRCDVELAAAKSVDLGPRRHGWELVLQLFALEVERHALSVHTQLGVTEVQIVDDYAVVNSKRFAQEQCNHGPAINIRHLFDVGDQVTDRGRERRVDQQGRLVIFQVQFDLHGGGLLDLFRVTISIQQMYTRRAKCMRSAFRTSTNVSQMCNQEDNGAKTVIGQFRPRRK